MVQHPSIAPPFLDESTLIDCNGKRGFAQGPNRTFSESPHTPTFTFPETINREGLKANARVMTGGDDDVQSYEVDPSSNIGWVCATSCKAGIVFGYVWPRLDYPWISLWCCSRNGKPQARGLEFGTTGLHQPNPILVRHPRIFGLPTFEHLDTGETRSRTYAIFLLRVPDNFGGVHNIEVKGKTLTLTEAGTATEPRRYEIHSEHDFFASSLDAAQPATKKCKL